MALDTIPKQEGGKLKAVASGTLPSGQPVVVNADGTVSVVSPVPVPQEIGSPTVFESAATGEYAATYDSNAQKVVIAYTDVGNSGYGTAVVGTVSGTSISFGSPVVFNTGDTSASRMAYDANAQKVVIAYRDQGNSNYGTAIVGTVSGTSISFGTEVVFSSANTGLGEVNFDSNSNKVVVSYAVVSTSGNARVGTVSGTSISFGSVGQFSSGSVFNTRMTFDSNSSKVVVVYTDGGNSNYGTANVGTVSGTSISFGAKFVFESASTGGPTATFDSNAQKVVIAYTDSGSSNNGTAIVGTVSGTSISFGSPVVFEYATTTSIAAAYDTNAQKVVIAYRDGGNSNYGTAIVGTVSGTSISFGSPTVFESARITYTAATYDSNAQKVVIVYQDDGNSDYGTSVVFQNAGTAPNLTSENYIGISTGGAVADGGNATVGIVGSVSDEQSGLTAGQQYYVQTDGTLSETPADPSVLAGTAISATKMVVKT